MKVLPRQDKHPPVQVKCLSRRRAADQWEQVGEVKREEVAKDDGRGKGEAVKKTNQ